MTTIKLNEAEQFFYKHAGYSYDPATETRKHGRAICAIRLADAESRARQLGWAEPARLGLFHAR